MEMEQCEFLACGQWNSVNFGPAWCGLVQIFTGNLCALSGLVPPVLYNRHRLIVLKVPSKSFKM